MAAIKQIQVAYDAVQDRLLARLNTDAGQEYRLWLTRRALKALWHPLREALARLPDVASQTSPAAKEALLSFRHEQAVAQAEFGGQFESQPHPEFPLGEEPMLAARIVVKPTAQGGLALAFLPAHGQGITLQLGEQLAHGLVRLLLEAHQKADWRLDLALTRQTGAERSTGDAVH